MLKKITARVWITSLIAALTVMLTILMTVNYIIDPFGLFGSTFIGNEQAIGNIRFRKIHYLKKYNRHHDAYIFGSSRAGVIPLDTLTAHFPSKKFYNMSVPNSNIWDQLAHLRYFVDKGFPVDIIFLQQDIDSIYNYEQDKFLFHPHPEVINSNLALYLLKSLIIYPKGDWKNRLHQATQPAKMTIAMEDGVFDMFYSEQKFQQDPDKYISAVREFQTNPLRKNFIDHQMIARKKADLQAFKDLCDAEGISLIVVTMPYNQIMMDGLNVDAYLAELASIAEVTHFWDFSGYNEVTTNNYNYYEESHYRPHVAKWMAARIFNDHGADNLPGNFGYLVNRMNIKQHLDLRKKEIAARDRKRFPM